MKISLFGSLSSSKRFMWSRESYFHDITTLLKLNLIIHNVVNATWSVLKETHFAKISGSLTKEGKSKPIQSAGVDIVDTTHTIISLQFLWSKSVFRLLIIFLD